MFVGVAAQRSSVSASPTTPAAPAPGSAGLVSVPVDVRGDLAQSPFDEPRQALIPDGWTISVWARVPKARLETWTPDGALLVSAPAAGQILKLTPKPGAAPQQSTLLDGLDQPHGMAFAGSTLYVAESDQIDAYDYVNGAATNPRTLAADLPDARSPELNGAYAHALKSVAVGPRRRGVLLDRFDRKHLCRGPRRQPSARDDHADSAGWRSRRTVRDGRPQRDRPRRRTRRFAVDGGEQPRQRAGPGRKRGHSIRQRTSAGGVGATDAEPGIGLALLQSRRRTGPPAVHPRHVDERRRVADGLRCATARRAELRRPFGPARAGVHDGCAAAAVYTTARSSASTAHGTGSRRANRKCRSSPGATAASAINRPLSAASRPTTGRDGAGRSQPKSGPTGPSTSVTTTQAPIYRLAPPGR